jgi:hypothetical protein
VLCIPALVSAMPEAWYCLTHTTLTFPVWQKNLFAMNKFAYPFTRNVLIKKLPGTLCDL